MEAKTNSKIVINYPASNDNKTMDKMRIKLKDYINSDYTYINSSNINIYKDTYLIIKELTIVAIERSFGVHRNEWFMISAYHKSNAIIKSRSWYCFFMNNYFNVSHTVIGEEMNLSRSGIKHYITTVSEDYSVQARKDYNKVLENIFKTDSELKYGW